MLGFYRAVVKLQAYLLHQSDRLLGKKHGADSGKLRRSLQEQSARTITSESVGRRG